MNTACILLSHVFVRPAEEYKLEQIKSTLIHYRLHNPNSHIVLTGHGRRPPAQTLQLCDHICWYDDIIQQEIDKGHPFLVNAGIDYAIQQRFTHLFKCRADGVILRKNIIEFCQNRLKDKRILLTQQTELWAVRAGDLFMYGELQFLKKCWNIATWYPTNTGLTSFAKNILAACNMEPEQWIKCLRQNAEFIDIFNIKWIDFRANWDILQHYMAWMVRNKLPSFEKYLWGTKERWHVFDTNGHMTSPNKNLATEKAWYEDHITSREPVRT